jgi:predicted amidophosphoribosyltransferase
LVQNSQGDNVDRALFKQYGIKTDEDEIDPQIPKICLVCEMPNEYDANLCTKCGKPLSIQAAIAAEEKEENEKNIVLEKLSNMENDMKEMQFRYHEVKNQSMSDDDLEKLAKKIKKLDDS